MAFVRAEGDVFPGKDYIKNNTGNQRLWLVFIIALVIMFPDISLAEQRYVTTVATRENVNDPVSDSDETTAMDTVVVTATRTKRKSSEVPGSVTVINSDVIEDTKMMNIKDALQGTPGVLIDSKNQGYDSRLIIRGAGLKARYGIRDIMVLLDGIPITDPDSLTRLDFVDTQLIDQVEVVKGPNSTLWGANASGGVINIMTKNPMDREQGGHVTVGLGNFETVNLHASYSGDIKDKVYYTAGGSHRESDNSWRRRNAFYTHQGTLQTAYVMDDGSFVESHIGYTKASLQLPGKLDDDMFEAYMDTGEADETEGPWQHSGRYSEIVFAGLRLNKQVGAFELKPMAYINSWSHRHPVTGRINEADTITWGTDFQMNHSHTLGKIGGTLTVGVTFRQDNQDTDYFEYQDLFTSGSGRIISTLSDEKGDLMEVESRNVDLFGIYIQETFAFFSKFIVDAGIRYDSVDFDISGETWSVYDYVGGSYEDESAVNSTQKTFDDISPRLGILYKLTSEINTYAAIAKGIKTPTEGEFSENPDLELVEEFNYEAGVKTRFQKLAVDAAAYYSPVKNEVVQVVQPDRNSEYVNAGKTEKKGFELSVKVLLPFYLDAGVNYSYTDYTFEEFFEPVRDGQNLLNVDRRGNYLPFIPRHQYALSGGFKHPTGVKCRLQTTTWGAYYMDNANTEKYKGYKFVTNSMVGVEKDKWEISLIMENLFDKQYASEVTKDTQGERTYTPAAPRSFLVKCRVDF